MSAARVEQGVTLAELLVVLALLGILAGIVGLAAPVGTNQRQGSADVLAAARRRAAETGKPVAVHVDSGARAPTYLALPDGRLIGPLADTLDPFTNHE